MEPLAVKHVLIALIRLYRATVAPQLPICCRFVPGCSLYATEALERHGAVKGGYLALRRLLRCHPFHAGGLDPVPPSRGKRL